LNSYKKELEAVTEIGEILKNPEALDGKTVVIGGLIAETITRLTKRNDAMANIKLEDFTGSVDVVVFPKAYVSSQGYIATDMAVKIKGRIDADEKGLQIIADRVDPLKVRYDQVRQVAIHIKPAFDTPENSDKLKKLLQGAQGQVPCTLYLHKQRKSIPLPPALCFAPDDTMVAAIEGILGPNSVELK
ncbi:MAG: DNA polymerase III subunit alpha, partial [Veillonella sp.]|nr:DNA polymerase III subunit alpha [Veillonella sp.]